MRAPSQEGHLDLAWGNASFKLFHAVTANGTVVNMIFQGSCDANYEIFGFPSCLIGIMKKASEWHLLSLDEPQVLVFGVSLKGMNKYVNMFFQS